MLIAQCFLAESSVFSLPVCTIKNVSLPPNGVYVKRWTNVLGLFPDIITFLLLCCNPLNNAKTNKQTKTKHLQNKNALKAYRLSELISLLIKSCQYSMFYTDCSWNFFILSYVNSRERRKYVAVWFSCIRYNFNVDTRNIHTPWRWTHSGKRLRMCEFVKLFVDWRTRA
jgi:hypothetical protein